MHFQFSDPDLMSGDGIYSRYLTDYYSAGRYEMQVTVNDNNKRAFVTIINARLRSSRAMPIFQDENLSPPAAILNRCCGSQVVIPESRRQMTGEFVREQKGPVIHLLNVPDKSIDLMQPSRISDLKLELLKSGPNVLATWTAPGDDYDTGKVSGYKFVYAQDMRALIDPFNGKYKTLIEFRRPDSAGVQTSYQLKFKYYNDDYFIGLIALDERGNEGKMSNIVNLYINSNEITTENNSTNPHQTLVSGKGEGTDEGVMIAILIGTFLVIALMLWAGIWYLRRHGKTTKNGGVNATLVGSGSASGGENHDTSSSDIGSKTPPRHHQTMVPQFSSLASGGVVGTYPGRGNGNKEPVGNTPTYWSASQLLDEHEQRTLENLKSTTTYHNNQPVQLDPIVEDPEDTYGISEMHQQQYGIIGNNNMTSTPIKYTNLTFPRRGQSVPPSPVSDSNFIRAHNNRVIPQEATYGYAHSEPPNGLYGSINRRKVPPEIPPKPSLSALLGLSSQSDTASDVVMDDVFSHGPPKISNNVINHNKENGGQVSTLSVRNISQV